MSLSGRSCSEKTSNCVTFGKRNCTDRVKGSAIALDERTGKRRVFGTVKPSCLIL